MKRWCQLLMVFGALQLLLGLALVPVGWLSPLGDHYIAWDRMAIAFRDGAIDAETYPVFASANEIHFRGEMDIGRSAQGPGNRSAELFLIWVTEGSQKLRFLAITFPWLLSGCGVVTVFFGWRMLRCSVQLTGKRA